MSGFDASTSIDHKLYRRVVSHRHWTLARSKALAKFLAQNTETTDSERAIYALCMLWLDNQKGTK